MNILVTGGAGYIGSAATKILIEAGHTVTIIDNLSKGQKRLVHPHATFYEMDLTDDSLNKVFEKGNFDAVMHFAAYKAAGESMENAGKYSKNIVATINVLDAMVKHNVQKIIFSSSAAVYGEPTTAVVTEEHPTNPMNYYGYGKLACEQIIEWYSQIHNIIGVSLRYFNVIGDVGLHYKNPYPQNILPIIEQVANGEREKVIVFGGDYDTRDGTGVRDYIELSDLIHAHVLALSLDKSDTINLGTGKGTTVLELIQRVEKEHGTTIPYTIGDRREGDPASVLASFEKAQKVLGWKPKSI